MMGSAYKLNGTTKLPHPSSEPLPFHRLENPKNPSTSSDTEEKNPKTLKTLQTTRQSEPSDEPLSIDGSQEDTLLINSEFLTQEEVLRRRSRRVKQLGRFYRNQYWALMEEVRLQYREYYWKYGKSPFNEEEGGEEEERGVIDGINGSVEVNGDGNRLGLGFTEKNNEGKINVNNNNRCVHGGCKAKAMALTNYCHQHILLDSKQKLYKACTYVTKRTCGVKILGATTCTWDLYHGTIVKRRPSFLSSVPHVTPLKPPDLKNMMEISLRVKIGTRRELYHLIEYNQRPISFSMVRCFVPIFGLKDLYIVVFKSDGLDGVPCGTVPKNNEVFLFNHVPWSKSRVAQTGIITCGKPVLRAAVPSLCTVHFQTAQKHVSRALKKAGLNISSSSKSAPKFHVIVAEYVRQIQAKRREARRVTIGNQLVKEENHN